MKTLLALIASVLLTGVANAQLLTEHFAYNNGNLGAAGIGSAVWTDGDSANAAIAVNTSAALTYPGLFGATTNGVVFSGGTFKKKAAPFASQASGSVYVSFLLSVQTPGSGAKLLAYLQNGNSASSSPPLGIYLNGSQIGLAKSASTPAVTAPNLITGTHLIVACYTFLAGNDRVDLWIDPTSLGSNTIPAATLTTGTASSSDAAALSDVFLNHAVSQTVWFDELRVGTSWAEVTPTDGTTPPVVTSAPVFTSITKSPAGLVMQGTNGTANGAFDLIASANVALPLNLWNDISADNFDAGGNFILTNPIAPSAPLLFYRLRVGSGTPPPAAPNITSSPTNLSLLAGQTAQFNVTATGTAPLSYRWVFNASTSVGTGAQLTLNNVQTNNAGAYFAIVTNVAGAVTSSVATLTVSNVLAPAGIVTQPQNQSVPEGQTAVFNVVASGTPPLFYQWFLNTSTPLPDQTNASLSLPNVSNDDAGGYSVTISNAYGTTNSVVAQLTIDTNGPLDFSAIGFCNNGAPITGGAAGPTVFVGSEEELQTYSDVNQPYTIYITNSFGLTSMDTHIRPNKTVIGVGNIVLSGGGLYLYASSNVIIRNLTITGSTEDGIGLHYSANVWIDHCTITDSGDGAIDLTQESDNVTISWCHIYYSSPGLEHRLASLIASSDSDSGNYRITYHHNWWGQNVQERMPSNRFGSAHVFNNYYNAAGNNYCIRTRKEAECLVENNFFQNVQNPWEQYITSSGDTQGKLAAAGNNVPFLGTANGVTWTGTSTNGDGTIRVMIPGTDTVFAPPYSYTLRAAADVPGVVTNNAGVGKGPFAP